MSRILHPLIGRVIGAGPPRWLVVEVQLREFGADDRESIDRYVAVDLACRVDALWVHRLTPYRLEMRLRHAWDGEPGRHFLVQADGEDVGIANLNFSTHDNLDLAWLGVTVHPGHRRRGVGTAAYEQLGALAQEMGRTKLGTDGWDHERTRGFAAARGWEQKSVAISRRHFVQELQPGLIDRLYDEALAYAGEYELVRIEGPTPDDQLPGLAEATAAINDAPLDDLEIEDEVFTADRVKAFETSLIARGFRMYRIIARHRTSGEIAGLTVVTVDSESPGIGGQGDTSVVRSHRGHRLGLLLKADMVRWLAEKEPQLETVDTWNAESNDHMVGVNERLGYQVMGRELQFQRRLPA
jgi:GNAT superfamily N-acetyltransferase